MVILSHRHGKSKNINSPNQIIENRKIRKTILVIKVQ